MEDPSLGFLLVRKLALILTFFTITPLVLFSSALSLISMRGSELSGEQRSNIRASASSRIYASSTNKMPSIRGEVIASDARPVILKNFLKQNNSPLAQYSDLIVEKADKYGLDYRLTTAIAMKESGACLAIPEGSFNCWGWGIHSKGILKFDSYEHGIEVVSKGLKENYIDKGYKTVEEIMKKYAHPNSTTWAVGVLYYMDRLQ